MGTPKPAAFGVAAHNDVNIEWWYINAHVTTDKGRHLALIGSFFRFGSGVNPLDGSPLPRAHYLIYAVHRSGQEDPAATIRWPTRA